MRRAGGGAGAEKDIAGVLTALLTGPGGAYAVATAPDLGSCAHSTRGGSGRYWSFLCVRSLVRPPPGLKYVEGSETFRHGCLQLRFSECIMIMIIRLRAEGAAGDQGCPRALTVPGGPRRKCATWPDR